MFAVYHACSASQPMIVFTRKTSSTEMPPSLIITYHCFSSLWKSSLVGGLVAIYCFPRNIGFLINPIDEVIFFRGVFPQPPTRSPQAICWTRTSPARTTMPWASCGGAWSGASGEAFLRRRAARCSWGNWWCLGWWLVKNQEVPDSDSWLIYVDLYVYLLIENGDLFLIYMSMIFGWFFHCHVLVSKGWTYIWNMIFSSNKRLALEINGHKVFGQYICSVLMTCCSVLSCIQGS